MAPPTFEVDGDSVKSALSSHFGVAPGAGSLVIRLAQQVLHPLGHLTSTP